MSGGANNGGYKGGQFGGLPLGGSGGGYVPANPQKPGGGGFGQQPPMFGNRPLYNTPFTGMPPGMSNPAPQTGGLQPQSTASPYGGPASRVPSVQQTGGGFPAGVSMGFQPPGPPSSPQAGMSSMPPRMPPMTAPGDYGSDFLMRALRGG